MEFLVRAFPRQTQLIRALGLTILAALTFTCTSNVLLDRLSPPAALLAFTVDPSTATAGVAITPAVVVEALDVSGNLVSDFTGDVTLTIDTSLYAGSLSGTVTKKAVGGQARFTDLSVDKAGTAYVLRATSGSLMAAHSTTFDISAGPASRLVFPAQPSGTLASSPITAGSPIVPAPQVSAEDALGNTVTSFSGEVTLVLGSNPTGATLSGTTTIGASSGVSTFSTLSIDKAGAGYRFEATSGTLTAAYGPFFDVAPGPASRLVCSGGLSTGIQVTVEDGLGNTVTSFAGNVTATLGTDPTGATLSGTTTVGAVAGVATFSSLSINRAGSGYTIVVSAGGLTTTCGPFTITAGPATRLVFTVQPTVGFAGAPITPALQVSAEDSLGHVDQTFTGTVTVSLGANPGGATLSGTMALAAVGGVATFSTLTIDKVGAGYTLVAAAAGLTSDASIAFNNVTNECCQLRFTVQPTNTTAGAVITPPVQVSAMDAFGNTDTNFVGNVTMAIGANPSGGALSGTLTRAAVAGVATFSNLSIDKAGTGYTLIAVSAVLTPASSVVFSIK